MRIFKFFALLLALIVPTRLYAQAPVNLRDLINRFFVALINQVVPIIVGAALVIFLWGLARFILNVGSSKDQEEGKSLMKWGILGLFIMVSVWGILLILVRSFGFRFGIPQQP
ncbi:MAG: hypothetical protein Q7S15_02340 [bacterium]|nr:hypothetical protein [bacterium]